MCNAASRIAKARGRRSVRATSITVHAGAVAEAALHPSQWGANSLMHHQTRRRPHSHARIENVKPRGTLDIKAIQRRSCSHAGDNWLTGHEVQRSQLAQDIGLLHRVDTVAYTEKSAGVHKSNQAFARNDGQKFFGGG